MHVRRANLNDLVALHALIEARSVTSAAERTGVTQSAMSHTLARLRLLFDDALFESSRAGLAPTPFCSSIAARVANAIGDLETLLAAKDTFVPAETSRTFRVASTDAFAFLALRPVLALLLAEAPRARLVLAPIDASTPDGLVSGRLDLVVGAPHDRPRGSARARSLLRDSFVAIVRRKHPLARGKATLARYAALEHLVVARDERPTFVDVALAARGLDRRIAARVPDFGVVAELVAGTDLVATVPRPLATYFAGRWPLVPVTLPMSLPFVARMYWHERHEGDRGAQWLRGLIERVVSSLAAPS